MDIRVLFTCIIQQADSWIIHDLIRLWQKKISTDMQWSCWWYSSMGAWERTRRLCDIPHPHANCIRFPHSGESLDTMTLLDYHHQTYVPIYLVDASTAAYSSTFECARMSATGTSSRAHPVMNWIKIKGIIDHIHEHTCGHEKCTDIRTLLVCNGLWTESVNHYLMDVSLSSPLLLRR